MKRIIRTAQAAALLACFATAGHAQDAAAPHAPPVNWNQTAIGYRYSDDFYFPGSSAKVTQNIGYLQTLGGFRYGSYFFNVDYLVSDRNNPEANGTSGAQEVYSVGHVDWSANKIAGRPMGYGFIRDWGVRTGFEFSSKNDAFGSRARMLVLGPSVQFAIPQGVWDLMVGLRTESNHNGIAHADVHYDTAWHVESGWFVPFSVGPVPMLLKGFAAITGPKGPDGFHVDTKTETLVRTSLLFDVGAFAGHPRTFYIGPGYEYWKNMFGTPSSEAAGTKRSAPMLVGEIQF
jgi:hypothetical protein